MSTRAFVFALIVALSPSGSSAEWVSREQICFRFGEDIGSYVARKPLIHISDQLHIAIIRAARKCGVSNDAGVLSALEIPE